MNAEWPELSDLLLDTDPVTLERRPIRRAEILETLDRNGMRQARRIVERIPGSDHLDQATIDRILTRSHAELQRLSYEFRNGERLLQFLRPLLDVLREHTAERPLRVVDIGCGMGFILRWIAAHGGLPSDVELVGCDFNPVLVAAAQRLATEERLACSFRVANAFTLEQPAHVFMSTGVLHHFRGEALAQFFAHQVRAGALAMLHSDIKQSWAAPIGSWIFHRARMREPLARHDGVLSAVRAHGPETLLEAATTSGRPLGYALVDGKRSLLPILRTLNTLVGIEKSFEPELRTALGRMATRLEPLS